MCPKNASKYKMKTNEHTFRFEKTNIDEVMMVTKSLTKKINKNESLNSIVWFDAM